MVVVVVLVVPVVVVVVVMVVVVVVVVVSVVDDVCVVVLVAVVVVVVIVVVELSASRSACARVTAVTGGLGFESNKAVVVIWVAVVPVVLVRVVMVVIVVLVGVVVVVNVGTMEQVGILSYVWKRFCSSVAELRDTAEVFLDSTQTPEADAYPNVTQPSLSSHSWAHSSMA